MDRFCTRTWLNWPKAVLRIIPVIYWEVCVNETDTGEAEVIQTNIQFAAILNIKEAVLLIGEGFKCPVTLLAESYNTRQCREVGHC